ncbi:vWA domain-containing protein [Streptomyces sp. NPDC002588]|uniref:vWA domain-containing protein n=1 Tax=Streptomyces sp. NPDC002588 TaxID=3154419 RepID=UPI00331BA74F
MLTPPPSPFRRRSRAAAVAACLSVALLLGASAARGSEEPAPSPDEIGHALHVDDVPATYVVLVDTSSSMNDPGPDGTRLYDTVRARLRGFLAGLAPSDQVSVVAFGRAVSVVQPLSPAGDARDAADALPAEAGESASDPGSALEAAAEQLTKSRTPVAAVLLLTDGAINAPGSPYAKLGSPGWKQLRERYSGLGTDRNVVGYGLPLTGQTHISDVLAAVFPTPRILPAGVADLDSQLDTAKDRVRADKAVRALREDDGSGVRLTVADPSARGAGSGTLTVPTGDRTGARRQTVRLTVTSLARHVPLRVRLRAGSRPGEPAVTADGLPAEPLVLPPGTVRTYDVTLTWAQNPRSSLTGSSGAFRSGLTVSADVASPWTPTVHGALGYPDFRLDGSRTAEVRLRGEVPGHSPRWALPLLLVLVVGGGFLGWLLHTRRRPLLSGELVVTDLPSGERITRPLSGRTVTLDIEVADVRARVRVRGRTVAGRRVLALDCVREPVRATGTRLSDSGTLEPGKSTVLCGIGFSHTVAARDTAPAQ